MIVLSGKNYTDRWMNLQVDVDIWLKIYNETRPHSGKYCYGKTPEQTFLEGIKIAQQKIIGHKTEQSSSDNTETLSVPV